MDGKQIIRRNLFKSAGLLAVSQALPSQWSKPVIDVIILPAHAQTSEFAIECDIRRGLEGQSPQISGGDLEIRTVIQILEPGVMEGDTADVRHQVTAAGYDQTFSGVTNDAGPNFFIVGGDLPISVPLPPGVEVGQNLEIEVTMTSGDLEGGVCSESLLIE